MRYDDLVAILFKDAIVQIVLHIRRIGENSIPFGRKSLCLKLFHEPLEQSLGPLVPFGIVGERTDVFGSLSTDLGSCDRRAAGGNDAMGMAGRDNAAARKGRNGADAESRLYECGGD